MRLQILKNLGLNFGTLINFFHPRSIALVFVVDLGFKDLALSLQIGQFQVDLLENVQFSIGLENGVLQVLHIIVGLLSILSHLIDVILMVYKSVNYWINEFLNQVSCLRLNIEPEQLEGGIVSRQTFKVS